jgi:hypothetical protein
MGRFIAFISVFLVLAVAFSATSDNFQITVSCQFMDVTLRQSASHVTDYTTWALGVKAAGAGPDTMPVANHIWVENKSNLPVDFSAFVESPLPSCSYGTPTAWTPGVIPGVDVFQLDLGVGTAASYPASFTNILATTAPGNTYLTAAPAGESHDLYGRFRVPSSSSDGCGHTLTVTIVISAH